MTPETIGLDFIVSKIEPSKLCKFGNFEFATMVFVVVVKKKS